MEQRVEECCGGSLGPPPSPVSPSVTRIFICDKIDTKIALSFFLALTSSHDRVGGLWSESVSSPPDTTVVLDVNTVDVNQPSDLDPIVLSLPSSVPSSVPSLVSSYFRFGLPVVRCITSPEHFSGSLPFLRL